MEADLGCLVVSVLALLTALVASLCKCGEPFDVDARMGPESVLTFANDGLHPLAAGRLAKPPAAPGPAPGPGCFYPPPPPPPNPARRERELPQHLAIPLGGDILPKPRNFGKQKPPEMADQTYACGDHYYRPDGCPNCGVKTPAKRRRKPKAAAPTPAITAPKKRTR